MKHYKPILFSAILISVLLLIVHQARAIEYQIQYLVPGMTQEAARDPGKYIEQFFTFGIYLAGFLAVVALAFGGITYMLGDSFTKTEKAKTIMVGAISGLVLLLCSYLLLYTIDPSLTQLSPPGLIKIDIPKLVEQYDLSPAITQGKTAAQVSAMIQGATIAGSGSASASIINSASTQVQGKTLAVGAATNYSTLRQQIQQACATQGLTCDTLLTSTIDGQHASTCHNASNAQKGGTCGDFEIMASECGGSIRNCPANKKNQYLQIASQTMNGSNNVTGCLNEYLVKGSQQSTGNHFHCNF